MIDIQQLTSLISAFRVETEKESISPETVGSILQAIADLLATATSETEYNIIRFWKETLQQYRFLYDIQQRNIDDHSNVILSLMARSMVDGATSSLTLAIGPATRTRAGVLTAEDYIRIQGIGETPCGNSGDLGSAKRRQLCRWFSRKYYASDMRLKEFLEENIGAESMASIIVVVFFHFFEKSVHNEISVIGIGDACLFQEQINDVIAVARIGVSHFAIGDSCPIIEATSLQIVTAPAPHATFHLLPGLACEPLGIGIIPQFLFQITIPNASYSFHNWPPSVNVIHHTV